jgi:hypothetical protein
VSAAWHCIVPLNKFDMNPELSRNCCSKEKCADHQQSIISTWMECSPGALTPPQVLAAGQHAKPPFVVYRLHCPSPLQHTLVRPGPQLLAAGQQPLPLHATLPGHVCTDAQQPPSGQAMSRRLQSLAPASGQVSQCVPATSLTIPGDPWQQCLQECPAVSTAADPGHTGACSGKLKIDNR